MLHKQRNIGKMTVKNLFLVALLAVGNFAWAEDAPEKATVSISAHEGCDYVLQGSHDDGVWHTVVGPIRGIEGDLEIEVPEGIHYERYRIYEFTDVGSVEEDKVLNDEELAQRLYPDWFYGLSHGNYFNAGIVAYHATNLVAPKLAPLASWASMLVNTLSIWAVYSEGFHKDQPHVVDAHRDEYGHPEHWMAASTSSLYDADWMSGYTDLSGWMAVFFFNALELASHSLGFDKLEAIGMFAGMFGDLTMSSYDFWNKAVRYSEVVPSSDPDEQAAYVRAWDGAWIYAGKLASAIIPWGAYYFAHKGGSHKDYNGGFNQGVASTLRWTGRAISAGAAASYIYQGLGSVDHGKSQEASE